MKNNAFAEQFGTFLIYFMLTTIGGCGIFQSTANAFLFRKT